MEKLSKKDGGSPDLSADNIARLREIFPEVFADGLVDFDALKQTLGEYVTDPDERYSFTWHGKSRARQIAQMPSTGTLLPCPEESVDWDSTKNIFIEGDNLEVLKLLQKSYHRKVKMIYIDPPYNTGKEFIYPDKWQDNLDTYLRYTGQVDDEGFKLSANAETSGRYHTNWLNMMYPRLKLARNLLRDDGFLFASINDIELSSLRLLCDEIFGEENRVGIFVWNTEGHTDNQLQLKVNHEYILCYRKTDSAELEYVIDPNTREESNLHRGFAENSITQNGPANPAREVTIPVGFPCKEDSLDLHATEVPAGFMSELKKAGYISRGMTREYRVSYPIRLDPLKVRDGVVSSPCRVLTGWKSHAQLMEYVVGACQPLELLDGVKTFYLSGNGVIYYHKTRERARNVLSVLRDMGTTEQARYELEAMGIPFHYPKPTTLIEYLVRVGSRDGDLVMDFFAGSCPLPHAVFNLAAGGAHARRFIAVQLPEQCPKKSEAEKAGFETIADIGKARMRYVLSKKSETLEDRALGLRVFKLSSSNVKPWEADFESMEHDLVDAIDNIKADRSEEDVLFELLLKYGLDLAISTETRDIEGRKVTVIGAGALVVCLSNETTLDVVSGIAALKDEFKPEIMRVVFKDSGFADDVAKTNAAQILKQAGIHDVKSL